MRQFTSKIGTDLDDHYYSSAATMLCTGCHMLCRNKVSLVRFNKIPIVWDIAKAINFV